MEVDREGRVVPFRGKVQEAQIGFCVAEAVNHETGCVQFVEELGVACSKAGVPLHLDAVQAWGKTPFSLEGLEGQEVATASLSGHKIGAPKGVGALYIHRDAPIDLPLMGGPQERERRPGTENLPGIAGLGAACRVIVQNGEGERRRMADLTGRLLRGILDKWPATRINGPDLGMHRLPNTLNLSFGELEAELLVHALDLEGVAVSAGAACSSGAMTSSPVLVAMGMDEVQARTGVRISLGAGNTPAGVDFFLTALEKVLERQEQLS
jgi:cysteine desulfurase